MCVGSWEREGTHVAQTTRWRPHGGGVISGQEVEEVQEEDVALGREGPLGVGQRREKQTDHRAQIVPVVWALQTPLFPFHRPLAPLFLRSPLGPPYQLIRLAV